MSHKAVVIGGGFGGLGAAIKLAQQGHQVTLLEKNDHVGGRASILRDQGFVRDMGPSRYLMPDVFEKFFESIGEKVEDHLTLTQLRPQYRIYFEEDADEEGPHYIDITGDIPTDLQTMEKIEPGVSASFIKYLKRSEFQYDIGMQFVYKNYDSVFDFFSWEVAKQGLKLKVFTTFAKYVKRYFRTSKMQKIVQYPLVFLGTAPYDAPALYNIMSHVDFNGGLFYPQGGIYAVVEALQKIAKKHGVDIRTNQAVQQLDIDPHTKRVSSVITQDSTYTAQVVVCNADMAWAETMLLPRKYQTYPLAYWKKKTFAPSAFLLYLGTDTKLPHLLHHTLVFSEDWKHNFGQIFDTKELPDTPSLYICCPSKTDPSVAPEGKENLFILVPIPNGIEISDEQSDQYEDLVYDLIQQQCHIDLRKHIQVRHRFHVQDFAQRYNAWQGTALGLAHKLSQTALLRPNNISKKVKNLFYVGHNTNPGIGMPMVLISAMLVDERVQKYVKKNPVVDI